ncbi:MAG TPA: hypothetical protein VK338_06135 [Candidatus Nitrosocosmicus sp.]|nr:hypothetical protein [Candidatus Nitrosocosmicus sp.]
MPSNMALATTIHDPEGRYAQPMQDYREDLLRLFSLKSVVYTPRTHPDTVRAVNNPLDTIMTRTSQAHARHISYNRRISLKELHRHIYRDTYVLYIDFDRLLRWISTFPEELNEILDNPSGDFTILGRTEKGFQSHPQCMREVEEVVNLEASRLLGKPVDIQSATFLMSREMSSHIEMHSRGIEDVNNGEWPIIAKKSGVEVKMKHVKGMVFENAFFSIREIYERGLNYDENIFENGYQSWIDYHYNVPAALEKRAENMRLTIEWMNRTNGRTDIPHLYAFQNMERR